MSFEHKPLRIISYLVPGISVELFELIAQYLEDVLGRNTVLCYESRFNGPESGRVDLFKANLADLAFISGSSYQKLVKEKNTYWEFVPVGAVHAHLNKGETTGYYADIIIHKNYVERIKSFLDLRGANWVTNSSDSTSGHFIMLKTLRESGENPSFFGSVLTSGSHLSSIQMVASRIADVATVDSNVLAYAQSKSPTLREDVQIFDSIGPLPPYPIMIRSSLPTEEKNAIIDALLKMAQRSPWNQRFAALNVLRFVKISEDVYLSDRDSRDSLTSLSAAVRYY